MKYWLFNKDPHNGFSQSLYNWVVWSPLYLNPPRFVSLLNWIIGELGDFSMYRLVVSVGRLKKNIWKIAEFQQFQQNIYSNKMVL